MICAGRRQEAERRGATVVLQTLTQNAREVFLLIARNQLEHSDVGLTQSQLFHECRDHFLCSNEMTLKAHLNEFKDHGLITLKKGLNGAEAYFITLSEDELERVMKEFDGPKKR